MSKRLATYLPDGIYDLLEEWASHERRSISNLAAFLLEKSVRDRCEQIQKEPKPEEFQIRQPNSQLQESNPSIASLLYAYILLTYRGSGYKQFQQMANDCKVSLQEIQAVLDNRPISEEAAGVFATKLQMSLDEFQAQYPVVRSSAGQERSDRKKELRDRS